MKNNKFLSIEHIAKTFKTDKGNVHALDDVFLSMAEGEFLAVVGPSGCGKSTLMMIVAGLLQASGGEVKIKGEKVDGPFTDLGIVFQNHVLLDWLTTMGNILFQTDMRRLPRKRYEARARELITMVSLEGFEEVHPYELSGGMKQRCAICRALLHDPPLLLMDEPFGSLDALTRDQLCIDLEKIWLQTEKTVLFITHSVPEAVQLADRIIVMTPRPGRIYKEIVVDLPRPRYEKVIESERFFHLIEQIKQSFLEQGVLRK